MVKIKSAICEICGREFIGENCIEEARKHEETYKRLSDEDVLNILYYKALGYKDFEIADKLNCSIPNIIYHIKKVREEVDKGRSEDIFWSIVANRTNSGVIENLISINE